MHKWAIPLAVVIGLGLAIPAGALANQSVNVGTGVRTCAVWDGRSGSEDNGYKVAVSTVFAAFILPLVILVRNLSKTIDFLRVARHRMAFLPNYSHFGFSTLYYQFTFLPIIVKILVQLSKQITLNLFWSSLHNIILSSFRLVFVLWSLLLSSQAFYFLLYQNLNILIQIV